MGKKKDWSTVDGSWKLGCGDPQVLYCCDCGLAHIMTLISKDQKPVLVNLVRIDSLTEHHRNKRKGKLKKT